MKRIIPCLYTLIIILILAVSLSSCELLFPGTGDGGDVTPEHEHVFNVQKISQKYLVSEATCRSGSVYYYSCECGEYGSEKFVSDDLLEHSFEDATCTEAKVCSECGEVQGTAKGHSWRSATCTTPQVCKTCGEVGEAALGHDWNEATCLSAKNCGRCHQTVGDPAGHKWIAADCIHPEHCDVCGTLRGDVLPHEYELGVCIHCGKVLGSGDGVELPIIPLD